MYSEMARQPNCHNSHHYLKPNCFRDPTQHNTEPIFLPRGKTRFKIKILKKWSWNCEFESYETGKNWLPGDGWRGTCPGHGCSWDSSPSLGVPTRSIGHGDDPSMMRRPSAILLLLPSLMTRLRSIDCSPLLIGLFTRNCLKWTVVAKCVSPTLRSHR